MSTRIYGSLARIADFRNSNFDVQPLPRSEWETGDYIEGAVVGTRTELYCVEDRSGHMVSVECGDWVIGALGDRAATLEGVGSWQDIGTDGQMHALTSAGLIGRYTSFSMLLADPLSLEYRGHLCRGGKKVRMRDFAIRSQSHEFSVPTLLMVGTSMSAGKTTTGRRVCQELDRAGLFVVGSTLAGRPARPGFSTSSMQACRQLSFRKVSIVRRSGHYSITSTSLDRTSSWSRRVHHHWSPTTVQHLSIYLVTTSFAPSCARRIRMPSSALKRLSD